MSARKERQIRQERLNKLIEKYCEYVTYGDFKQAEKIYRVIRLLVMEDEC